jgi:hypothetical protein
VAPSSRLTNSPASSTPANSVSGSDGWPAVICQIRFSSKPLPSPYFGLAETSRQLSPMSSLTRTVVP